MSVPSFRVAAKACIPAADSCVSSIDFVSVDKFNYLSRVVRQLYSSIRLLECRIAELENFMGVEHIEEKDHMEPCSSVASSVMVDLSSPKPLSGGWEEPIMQLPKGGFLNQSCVVSHFPQSTLPLSLSQPKGISPLPPAAK